MNNYFFSVVDLPRNMTYNSTSFFISFQKFLVYWNNNCKFSLRTFNHSSIFAYWNRSWFCRYITVSI